MMIYPNQSTPLVLLGAGGHAKVLLSLIRALDWPILGVCAPELNCYESMFWRGIKVLSQNDLDMTNPNSVALVNGVGRRVGDNNRRQTLYESYKGKGYIFPSLVHPRANVDFTVRLDEGAQIMAGAIVQTDTCVGANVIINTSAVVDHDCVIANHVHIAPGAVVCGNVNIARGAFIGCGSQLSQGITIGEDSVVGAGVSIVRNVAPNQLVLPAAVRCSNLIRSGN